MNNIDGVLYNGVSAGVERMGLGDGIAASETEVAGSSNNCHLPLLRQDAVSTEERERAAVEGSVEEVQVHGH